MLRLSTECGKSFFSEGAAFDAQTMFGPAGDNTAVLDAAFVDDEAIAIFARTLRQLDESVNTMLRHILRI